MSDEEENKTGQSDIARLKAAAALLHQHFDTVQILCTRVDDEGETVAVEHGRGNFLARLQQARDWITYNDELVKKSAWEEG